MPSATLIGELAQEARTINAANGWGEGFTPQELPTFIALIHSEVTEVWEAMSTADTAHELGDVIIRSMDLAELLAPGALADAAQPSINLSFGSLAESLMRVNALASGCLEAYRKEIDYTPRVLRGLSLIIYYCWALIPFYAADRWTPEEIVRSILAKNATRGHRHGGRRV